MTGSIAWVGWCVWVIAVLAVTSIAVRTEMRGTVIVIAGVFYFCLAGIAVLLSFL